MIPTSGCRLKEIVSGAAKNLSKDFQPGVVSQQPGLHGAATASLHRGTTGAILYPAQRQARLGDYVEERVGLRDRKRVQVIKTSKDKDKQREKATGCWSDTTAADQTQPSALLQASLTGGYAREHPSVGL